MLIAIIVKREKEVVRRYIHSCTVHTLKLICTSFICLRICLLVPIRGCKVQIVKKEDYPLKSDTGIVN